MPLVPHLSACGVRARFQDCRAVARRERRCCFYKLFQLFPEEHIGKLVVGWLVVGSWLVVGGCVAKMVAFSVRRARGTRAPTEAARRDASPYHTKRHECSFPERPRQARPSRAAVAGRPPYHAARRDASPYRVDRRAISTPADVNRRSFIWHTPSAPMSHCADWKEVPVSRNRPSSRHRM